MFESGRLTNFGPFVREFERRAAEFLGVKYAVSVASGTTGLCLLLNTLPRGSEVLLPSFTFLATAQAVIWNGLIPRFVDIDPQTYCISAQDVREQITSNTSAILGVHVFGVPCAVDDLAEIARSNGIALFYDSAHAFGSRHGQKSVGTFGTAEVFSFSATKVLAADEGGMVATSNEEIFQAIIERRNYGFDPDHACKTMGLNGKMSEFSAALCNRGLSRLDQAIERRNVLAQCYRASISQIPGIEFQLVPDSDLSTFKDFTVLVDSDVAKIDRDNLAKFLMERGIEVASYFCPPIHQLGYFQQNFPHQALPNTDAVASKILSLPMYSDLSQEDLHLVVNSIRDALS